jgi:hypothetical protein
MSASDLQDLRDILEQAVKEHQDLHPGTCASAETMVEAPDGGYDLQASDQPCDCWISRAQKALKPRPASDFAGQGRKWDGEECGTCGDSSVFHTGGTGLCTRVNCECFKFVPTGRANTKAR